MALGVRQGDAIVADRAGGDADAARRGVAALIAGGLGEGEASAAAPPSPPQPAPPPPVPTDGSPLRLQGRGRRAGPGDRRRACGWSSPTSR